MAKDIRKQLKKDIEKFEASGKLPKEWDVRPAHRAKKEFRENVIGPDGDSISEIDTLPDKHNYFICNYFEQLSAEILNKLSPAQKDVYDFVIIKGMTEREAAVILMKNHVWVHRRVMEIKKITKALHDFS